MTTEEETAALREATRQAHEVLGDLRRAIKDGERLVKEAADVAIKERFEPVVAQGLKEFGDALGVAIEESTQAVFARFDQITDTLLGEDKASRRRGKPSIPDLADKEAQRR